MKTIIAITENERSNGNEIFQGVAVLYNDNHITKYEFFEKIKNDHDTSVFVACGYEYSYGKLDTANILIELETPQSNTKPVYKLQGINDTFMFGTPLILHRIHDVNSYLQVKYAGYIGELDTIL